MKSQIEMANSLALAQPRMPLDTPWDEIYEQVKAFPYKGLVDIEFDQEVQFVVDCLNDDAIALQYLWTGGQFTEPLSYTVWKTLAKRSRTTLDVGAYTGFYSLIAASVNSAPIYAYEPVSFIFSRLAQNVMLNGFANVKFKNSAVSDKMGTVDIGLRFGPRLFSSGSSIVEDMVSAAAESQPTRTVTLDAEHISQPVDLIKVDVEGAEVLVLKGALELLAEKKPVLLFETCASTHDECMELFEGLGFDHIKLERSGVATNSLVYSKSSYLYPEIEALKKTFIAECA